MKWNRRQFLRSSTALALLGATPLGSLSGRTLARTPSKRTLVVVFLRGGIDGLNLVVPHGEGDYYRLRPGIAVPRPGQENGALDLDGFFGLHPWAAPLLPHFRAGSAVALNAVGYDENTRSHFEEQDVWETGILGNSVHSDGWLNRHLATSEGHGPVRAVSVGDTLPRLLRGKEKALAIRSLEDLSLGTGGTFPATAAALRQAYGASEQRARELVEAGGAATLEALEVLQDVAEKTPPTKTEYPQNEFAVRMREVARLIRAEIGLEVAVVDYGGWDTHQNQGGVGGAYSNLVRNLAGGLDAFARDLNDRMDDVLVVTLSEFGRTAFQNGTNGTDHGWGNCLLALGGAVASASSGTPRQVIGRWPGMSTEALHQARDLAHTTDFRDVLAEVATKHLGTHNSIRFYRAARLSRWA